MLRTAVIFSQHTHVCPCQDHPAAVLHLAELCRTVHGVCGGGLAVRFQPLHLPLLRSLHCLRKDAPLHHKVSKQVSSIPDTHDVVVFFRDSSYISFLSFPVLIKLLFLFIPRFLFPSSSPCFHSEFSVLILV